MTYNPSSGDAGTCPAQATSGKPDEIGVTARGQMVRPYNICKWILMKDRGTLW